MKKIGFTIIFICLLAVSFQTHAIATGAVVKFNVDSDYDILGRKEVDAVLVLNTNKLYFYVEKSWWDSQLPAKQNEITNNFTVLSNEFETKIYSNLTSVFGSEWKPGIDGDERIALLFHLMKTDVGGYFRTADEYLKLQLPTSNEREMLYLPLAAADNLQLKRLLAHEFTHLITFNQKEKTFNVSEEVWLNEARAEYALTLLGYDSNFDGSNLQKRVQAFAEKPSDSLTEWQNAKYDYAAINLFTQYLVDHYSVEILSSSLRSRLVGIPSLNEALQKSGAKEDFSQIFTNWTIAVFLNNCALNQKYCYLSNNLKNFRLNPSLNFLPLTNQSSLSVTDVTKNWAGNWQRIIGGNGNLVLEFKGLAGLNFKIPYLVQNKEGSYLIGFIVLDKNQAGKINVVNFGSDNRALIIIPSLQSKTSGFDGLEPTYPFTFTVSVAENITAEEALRTQLLAQILFLQQEIARIRAQLAGSNPVTTSCSALNTNLSIGLQNNNQVRCLQGFLKNQGVSIYPEALVTGNFGLKTKAAVIRFQEKYSQEILAPFGLQLGTGFVGQTTRAKINQMLGG